ncbi:putative F-box domain-containing protein [Helianthus annuus]|uniref:F-box domain-containing protein n=1 Tax=Helianthus annuus TaxID=4232 RepID=A0A251SWN3_HELAN|nr:F-box/LRR-repeat protein At5g63520 isoform X2 [Helianthus annuus]KAF5817167.1 putative F-box domain-containing protein [Helianthus annuus]KAJ0638337.1 putative F-box domain-containing protein [Helianthus annuus]KAJ0776137.1 putative F-box domain-containing protein [Helianthus annuus]KAJ0950525.1 putative F-box domain-containing protein [Helianthus annuus]
MTSRTLRQIGTAATIDLIGEDLLHNIVGRLPATSFASAACVSRFWNLVCDRVLCRPKLSSACSPNPSLEVAVEEVVNKVLSEPIRPHFAIASLVGSFENYEAEDALEEARGLITAAVGTHVPVITHCSLGIISDESQEVTYMLPIASPAYRVFNPNVLIQGKSNSNRIMLTVGFLPGMKVTAIPLLQQIEEPETLMFDKFVTDIREFSTSVSGCNSPAAIIMFGDRYHDGIINVVEKMDYAMSPKTVIVGDPFSRFQYTKDPHDVYAAVALVFAVERNKPPGIGETQFHAVLASRLSPVGPTYKVSFVRKNSTWIAARREGSHENIDGETLLNQVYDALGKRIPRRCLFIAVTKKRKCSFGQEKAGCMTSLTFHKVSGTSQEYLHVFGVDIKTGDTFRFYHPSDAGLSSVTAVSSHLRSFNQRGNNTTGGDKHEVFGGLIFTCGGENFFGQSNIDSSPFLDNFPGVTLGGTLCRRVIGRGVLTLYPKESQGQKAVRSCVHPGGIVYLIMSYTP